ncbi:MAG: glycosyltransferase [Lachnospiraceae bacterium]|nr:glycosyltransferase [Lachnospiraceae bacterium]
MKKVLLFTHNLSGGGAEKAMVLIAGYFAAHPEEEIRCTICVVYDHEETRRRAEAQGIPVIVMKHKSRPEDSRWTKGINVLRQIAEMRQIKREGQYDTCVSFLPGADLINVSTPCGERQIVSMRTQESAFTPNILKKIYTGRSLRRCDRIVAVTEMARIDAIRFFRVPEDKIVTIHNAIEEPGQPGETDPEYQAFAAKRRVIVHAGRLIPVKRQDLLIRAFTAVHRGQPDLGLLILGDGPEREKLQKIAAKEGVAEEVFFAGHRANPQDYMRSGAAFVMSSDAEGMPNVVLEAMQCGLPVVSTACGAMEILDPMLVETGAAVTDVTEGVYGLICPTGDAETLARAIGRILSEEQLRTRYRERAGECLRDYTWERIAAQWKREF